MKGIIRVVSLNSNINITLVKEGYFRFVQFVNACNRQRVGNVDLGLNIIICIYLYIIDSIMK